MSSATHYLYMMDNESGYLQTKMNGSSNSAIYFMPKRKWEEAFGDKVKMTKKYKSFHTVIQDTKENYPDNIYTANDFKTLKKYGEDNIDPKILDKHDGLVYVGLGTEGDIDKRITAQINKINPKIIINNYLYMIASTSEYDDGELEAQCNGSSACPYFMSKKMWEEAFGKEPRKETDKFLKKIIIASKSQKSDDYPKSQEAGFVYIGMGTGGAEQNDATIKIHLDFLLANNGKAISDLMDNDDSGNPIYANKNINNVDDPSQLVSGYEGMVAN